MVETRKTEVRFTTSDPKEMLNKYLVKDVHKTWKEDFLDDTGTVVQIDRNSLLFTRGTVITQDVLAKIRFHMDAGEIKEVEVSNQQRVAFEWKNTLPQSYMAQVLVGDRKMKFLLKATGVQCAIDVLKDYIELNYKHGFELIMVKKFDVSIILVDTLKKFDKDDAAIAYMKDEIEWLQDQIYSKTFTPKISLDTMKSISQLSAKALRTVMLLADIKASKHKETHDELLDRTGSLVTAIIGNMLDISLKDECSRLQIGHEFQEPFGEDIAESISNIINLYDAGLMSQEGAVELNPLVKDHSKELKRIKNEKEERQRLNEDLFGNRTEEEVFPTAE